MATKKSPQCRPGPALSNEDWQEIWQFMCQTDHWRLEDAARMLLGLPPAGLEPKSWRHTAQSRRDVGRVVTFMRNCLDASLRSFAIDPDPNECRVHPGDVIAWAEEHDIDLPRPVNYTFTVAARKAHHAGRGRQLQPRQIHRERCIGIAAYLWANTDPDLRALQMVRKYAGTFRDLGCEGTVYSHDVLKDWIRTVAPLALRKGGRPRKDVDQGAPPPQKRGGKNTKSR